MKMTANSNFPWLPYMGQAAFVIAIASGALYRLQAAEDDIAAIQAKELPERVVRIETKVEQISDGVEGNKELLQELLREVSIFTLRPAQGGD